MPNRMLHPAEVSETWTAAQTAWGRLLTSVDDHVRSLEKLARGLGVDLNVHDNESEKFVYVSSIERREGKPGAGATVLRMVQEYARSKGKDVQLECDGPVLRDYYIGLGFIATGYDADGFYDMVWSPC